MQTNEQYGTTYFGVTVASALSEPNVLKEASMMIFDDGKRNSCKRSCTRLCPVLHLTTLIVNTNLTISQMQPGSRNLLIVNISY